MIVYKKIQIYNNCYFSSNPNIVHFHEGLKNGTVLEYTIREVTKPKLEGTRIFCYKNNPGYDASYYLECEAEISSNAYCPDMTCIDIEKYLEDKRNNNLNYVDPIFYKYFQDAIFCNWVKPIRLIDGLKNRDAQ